MMYPITWLEAYRSTDGRGSGEWRKLSVNIPASVRAAIKERVVRKFDVDGVRWLFCPNQPDLTY